MAEVGEVKYKVVADDSDLDSQISKTEGKLTSKFGGVAGTIGKIVTGAVVAGTAAVGAFAKSSVDAGMQFDSSMSQVAATMGKTVDEIQDLRDFAQEMGSKTAFSATEAADALNYMALAGYDSQKSMEMLPNVLNLAAAGGMELARASDMITDSQSALGLNMQQTNTLVDQMAAAASKSNTSVEQLGDAILTVGGTAKNLAGGTTELSTALGLLADNGIKGSEGGTALRNIILSLSAPTDKAAKQLKSLGIEAFDANGNMKPLEDIMGQFNKSLGNLTQEEKTQALNNIFNKVDLKSVNALLATSTERWGELSGAIEDSQGAAEKMANTQLDNLAGDITLFQSALEGAKIAVSDGLTPTLREFVQFGTDGLSQITDAFKADGLEGAMDAFGGILSDGLAMIIEKLPAFVDAGIKLIEALINGIIDNLPLIIDSALQITMTLLTALLDNLPKLLDAGLQIIVQLALGIAEALPELVPAIVDCVLEIVDVLIENAPLLLDAAMALIKGLAEGLIEALPQLIERLPEIIEAMVSFLIENIPAILEFAIELMIQLAAALIENIPTLIAALPEIIMALVKGLLEGLTKINEVGAEFVSGLWEGIKGAWGKLVDNVTSLGKKLVDKVKGFFEIGSPSKVFKNQVGRWIPEGIAEGIDETADDATKSAESMVDQVMRTVNGSFNTDINFNMPDIAGYAKDLSASMTQTNNIQIEVPLTVDGREIARASAWYMNEQLAWESRG
ncbi:MAG: phage tail tape measure protein [Clostridia bacterium]|nr:phage tail tape measure protein [Clostridia bacterium]